MFGFSVGKEEVRAAGEEAARVVPRAPLAAAGAALAGDRRRAALAPLAGREDRRRARVSRGAAARAAVFAR